MLTNRVNATIYIGTIRGLEMRKFFLTLVSALFLFPYLAMSDVNFKEQTIKDTLAQATTEQKLIFSV
jgi:hypothetical protein